VNGQLKIKNCHAGGGVAVIGGRVVPRPYNGGGLRGHGTRRPYKKKE